MYLKQLCSNESRNVSDLKHTRSAYPPVRRRKVVLLWSLLQWTKAATNARQGGGKTAAWCQERQSNNSQEQLVCLWGRPQAFSSDASAVRERRHASSQRDRRASQFLPLVFAATKLQCGGAGNADTSWFFFWFLGPLWLSARSRHGVKLFDFWFKSQSRATRCATYLVFGLSSCRKHPVLLWVSLWWLFCGSFLSSTKSFI